MIFYDIIRNFSKKHASMRPLRLNLYHVITFYFVASEKSFSTAAEKLCLTQPAVTMQIHALEKSTKVKLLDVRKKKVYLTQAGETLFTYAQEIYDQASAAERSLDNFSESGLRIGCALTFSHIVASAASVFEELHPDAKLTIRNASSHDIIDELLALHHDIGVVVRLDDYPDNIVTEHISDYERMVFVTSPQNPVLQRGVLELHDLATYPLLLPAERSATREILLKTFKTGGIEAKQSVLVDTDYLDVAQRLAEEGRGIALMHVSRVEDQLASGKLHIVPVVNEITIGVDLLIHRGIPLPTIASKFISVLRETFQMYNSHNSLHKTLAES